MDNSQAEMIKTGIMKSAAENVHEEQKRKSLDVQLLQGTQGLKRSDYATPVFYMWKNLQLLLIPHPLVWDYSFDVIKPK